MKSKRIDRKRKRQERRRRYKKNYDGLFLSIKIACICYLTIFGTSYMSSGTSAFFSSQGSVSSTISAGVWEVPAINYCNEEDEVGAGLGEEIVGNHEDKEDILIEEDESTILPVVQNDVDPISQEDESKVETETGIDTLPVEGNDVATANQEDVHNNETNTQPVEENDIDSVVQEESIEENEQNVDTSEEVNIDQGVNEDNPVEESVEVVPVDETEVDCEEKDDEPMEVDEEGTTAVEVDCKNENAEPKEEQNITPGEEIEQDVISSEETKVDCGNIDMNQQMIMQRKTKKQLKLQTN